MSQELESRRGVVVGGANVQLAGTAGREADRLIMWRDRASNKNLPLLTRVSGRTGETTEERYRG